MNIKNKKEYLYSIALFMSFLIVTIPFYTADVFAAADKSYVNLDKEMPLEEITGAVAATPSIESLDPGEACNEKIRKGKDLIDFMDNGIIKTLERILSVLHAINAVWTAAKAILNTVILALYAAAGFGCGWCAAKAKALEGYRQYEDKPLILFGGDLVNYLVGCKMPSKWQVPNLCEFNIKGYGQVSPFTNIYAAIGCFCLPGILFNMRKLKTIYQTYNCCIEQTCREGINTEPCERQLSEATCMYWGKGAILSSIVQFLISALVKLIFVKLIERWIPKNSPVAGTVLSIANLPFEWKNLEEGLRWAGRSFSEPTCKDLGFEKLKEERKKELKYHKVGLVDTNDDGRVDGITATS